MFTEELTTNENKSSIEILGPTKRGLDGVWAALISGRYRVIQRGVTAQSHYFEIAPVAESAACAPLAERKLRLVVAVLLGSRQKTFAIDAACSPSTVTSHLGDCLHAFGFHRHSHRLPLLMVAMVHVLFGHIPSDCVQVDEHQAETGNGWIVQSHRPELGLARRLSEAEMAVLSGRVQGHTYAEIARERGTSARTVANQISNIHKKLAISGRMELLCYLASQLEPRARTIAA